MFFFSKDNFCCFLDKKLGNIVKVFFPSVNSTNLAKFVQNFVKCLISQFLKKTSFHDGN
jgi:hypothetical protein